MRGQRATGKIQRINYHHGSCGSSSTGKTSSVSLIFTHRTHRNAKNLWVRSSLKSEVIGYELSVGFGDHGAHGGLIFFKDMVDDVLLIWVTNSTVNVSGFASANLFKMSQTKLENTGIAIRVSDIIHHLAFLINYISCQKCDCSGPHQSIW